MKNERDRTADVEQTSRSITECLTRRARQQAAVVELGCAALSPGRLADHFQTATERAAEALTHEFGIVLERLPERNEVRPVAGVGWNPGIVGSAMIDTGLRLHVEDTLRSGEPVVVVDVREETRFDGRPLLLDDGIVSGLSAVIGPRGDPWGVFAAYTARRVDYAEDDVDFVRAVAKLLWAAIQRERYEETIRHHLAEINAVYDNAPFGLCFLDRHCRYVRVNDRLAEINGLPAADHLGRTPEDVVPDIAPHLQSVHRQVIETGKPVLDIELRGTTPSDRSAPREWLASYLPLWSDGEISGVSVVVREITEQKRVDRELRELNETLEEQVQLRSGIINVLHDIATHVHEATSLEEAVQFVLRRAAEFNGWSFGHAFLVLPEDADRLVPIRAYYEHSEGAFREFREATEGLNLRRGDGLPGRALAAGAPVWAANLPGDLRPERADVVDRLPIASAAAFPVPVNGHIELVLEFFSSHRIEDDERIRQGMENIGAHLARTIERLRAEAALRESEQRFRELAESVDQVFWVLDPDSDELLYISPAWSRIVGVPTAQHARKRDQWRKFVHQEDRKRIEEEFQTSAARGGYDVVYRVNRADGSVRWMHDVAVPVRNAAGAVHRIIGVAEDVTEQRELQREIANAATHEQQRLSRDLHDSIGQELTGLTMMAARLAGALEKESPKEAKAAASVVAGLKHTLQQVRRISRGLAPVNIEAGGLTVALAQLVEQTRQAGTTDCMFRCEEPVTLRDPAVATHLYRIAQEAVSNAVKHAQAANILVKLDASNAFCELTIEDNGLGLMEGRDACLEGMGLKIMRYRANLIGAHFRVSSAASGGTRVSCRVPQDGNPSLSE